MSSKEVMEGKSQVAKIADVLNEINKTAKDASSVTTSISEAGQQLVSEVERVVRAINEVAAIAKESAATVQEVLQARRNRPPLWKRCLHLRRNSRAWPWTLRKW